MIRAFMTETLKILIALSEKSGVILQLTVAAISLLIRTKTLHPQKKSTFHYYNDKMVVSRI